MNISERSLYVLLVLAVALTLVGGVASMATLGRFELPVLTGFATATGKVNVTIEGGAVVSLPVAYVDFGNGSLSGTWTAVNTIAAANPSTFSEPQGLTVRNDGNVDVNITINGSTPATFIGGTNPTYAWNTSSGAGGCPGDSNLTATVANFSNTQAIACTNLSFVDGTDDFDIEVYLQIPSDAGTGLKQDTLIVVVAEQYP